MGGELLLALYASLGGQVGFELDIYYYYQYLIVPPLNGCFILSDFSCLGAVSIAREL